MTEIPGRYWSIGVTTALLAHAALSVAVFWQPAESGARSTGMGGIEIALGPSGGSPGSVAEQPAPVTETKPIPPDETTEAERPEQSETPLPETVAARTVTPVTEKPAVPVENSEPVEVREVPESREKPKANEVDSVEAEPAEQPATANPPEKQPEEVIPEDTRVTTSPPSATGAEGKAGTESAKTAGSGSSTSGGGVPGASADYLAALRAWLEKHKRYPRRARRLRQEGTALLYFVMNRRGEVLEYRIRESSGHEALDEEVAAMIERAQPLPGIPEDLRQGRLELVVPVQFFLL